MTNSSTEEQDWGCAHDEFRIGSSHPRDFSLVSHLGCVSCRPPVSISSSNSVYTRTLPPFFNLSAPFLNMCIHSELSPTLVFCITPQLSTVHEQVTPPPLVHLRTIVSVFQQPENSLLRFRCLINEFCLKNKVFVRVLKAQSKTDPRRKKPSLSAPHLRRKAPPPSFQQQYQHQHQASSNWNHAPYLTLVRRSSSESPEHLVIPVSTPSSTHKNPTFPTPNTPRPLHQENTAKNI